MTTYYHIAHPSYQVGEPLLCRSILIEEGLAPEWAWESADEGFDDDVVCLFPSLEEAEEARDSGLFEADSILLRVELPDDVTVTHVSEGYPAVYSRIDPEYIALA